MRFINIIDGDKGGRKANECRKVGLFMDYHHRLETVKANCGAAAGQFYTMAFNADKQPHLMT